eukprot:TRINITY_DN8616_c0_g2_i2.p1 TRINITY_DN8616_c0_g2~~TRINITY_DN8616_c0_g2_i2.p1  ORF type:complete len:435 (+),score=113.37 TRINITY_DN8616_c0_g2_i2:52-1305(+)
MAAKSPKRPSDQSSGGRWFRRQRGHRRTGSNASHNSEESESLSSIGSKFRGLANSLVDRLTKDSAHGFGFLSQLNNRQAEQDASHQVKRFIAQFESEGIGRPVDEQAKMVQDFYAAMQERIDTSAAWRDVTDEAVDKVMDGLERYIMQHIYDWVFLKSDEDEEKDLRLQSQIRSLHWITPERLEAAITLDIEEVAREVENAQEELITMDAMRAPQDKLQCVVACSKSIFRILEKSSGPSSQSASADDFLPAMIYVLIKANPPMLHSNMQYIDRFTNPAKLMAGEAGYYYTNLMGAASFIENVKPDQLHMSQDEFDHSMRGSIIEATEGLESIRNLKSLLERMRNVENKQLVLQEEVTLLIDTLTALTASSVKPVKTVPEELIEPTEYTKKMNNEQAGSDETDEANARLAIKAVTSPS